MGKNNKVLVFLVFFYPFLIYAQPPGYLGKRASITFNVSGFPALTGPTQNNYGDDEHTLGESAGWLGLNYEFEGNFSYAVKRYQSLGVSVGQYYTGIRSQAYTDARGTDVLPPGGSGRKEDQHDLLHRANVRSLSLLYSTFSRRRGALAPLGNRFYMGLKYNLVNSEIIDKKTEYYAPALGPSLGHEPLNIDTRKGFVFLLLGWSNDLFIRDRFIFRSGFRFGLPLDSRYVSHTIDGEESYAGLDLNSQINYDFNLIDRLARHELLRVDIGIGILLF